MKTNTTNPTNTDPPAGRLVGLDSHPDTFTAAVLEGQTPAAAITQKVFNKLPMSQLTKWAKTNLNANDRVVLEASGNSFQVVRTLQSAGFEAQVLESGHLGKLKEAHASNDRISAIRIGKAYLAGTAKIVWVPDLRTQERRDVMHAHRKAVKRSTQTVNRLDSYLSDNGVRLKHSLTDLDEETAKTQIQQARQWSPAKWAIVESYLTEMRMAGQMRQRWEQAIALEVIDDPVLLSLTRLVGVRDIVAYYLGAVIGDIQRFKSPKSLVKYFGLDPVFDDSGNEQWSGGIGGHGHGVMRAMLLESAQCILRTNIDLGRWGRRLARRKSSPNLAAAAVARRLTVAIWYLLQGKYEGLKVMDLCLSRKVGKIISKVGPEKLKEMGTDRKTMRQRIEDLLKNGRIYRPVPDRVLPVPPEPKPELNRPSGRPMTLAEEYGLV